MKLFGNHDKQTIEVRVDPAHVQAGGTVTATVRVTGPPDDKARGVAARLVSKHRWSSKSTDEDGDTTINVHNDIGVVAESTLIPAGQPVVEGDYSTVFVVPPDACRTVNGALGWAVQGVISHRLRSTTAECALQVNSNAKGHPEITARAPELVGGPAFHVEVSARDMLAGAKICGTVIVEASKAVTYKSLDVDLRLVRGDGQNVIAKGAQYSVFVRHGSVHFAEQLSMPAGTAKAFPFELGVPADAVATLRSLHTVLTWYVVATGTTGALHADHQVHLALDVH
ncbi:hypothetical protein CLV47_104116 [Antricoccus suffuscus]|uniref:Arrestin-like N-terminal domain-containing protein n=1 Tax=Antricoccus suffuscus TaxID=1629062 RepID=A0A2T1A2D0_9ACTN|nr:hypothetical protein [Antricoccus suffuscus]PRZ42770.1 hypothetical protein CLV47_104116 [Antricoccus suffuscus]